MTKLGVKRSVRRRYVADNPAVLMWLPRRGVPQLIGTRADVRFCSWQREPLLVKQDTSRSKIYATYTKFAMCHSYRLVYAYGCRIKDPYNFYQCNDRQGTTARCDPIKVFELEKDHYCAKHLVGRGAVIMASSRRRRLLSEEEENEEEEEEEEGQE
ncbi:uncharacterized protein BO95DRAFT_467618 [Aspergillus brunneoviolaceus CBS 621.78]|uniref:Uncharacterized protein n=1 Tax=Aspergillus brunneoviolaceus CBS 621.78 TaxID=1450534 RepID=A0ACD1FXJ4_9EURO|nr:hypothetical protein BO95DRAFT_467618 [Aspergillus brunneoviolaceus CBS 621.78]RAH41727.1 hypothetical protein BO95DRAFT_467618 [Aspergillus brunneoviolaceus CBS 621.78]